MTTALTEATKERVRYHLGYLSVDPVSAIPLGFPSAGQAQFLLESAMERLRNESVGRVEKILAHLERIEAQDMEANKRLKAQQLGDLKLRNTNEEKTENELLDERYVVWAHKLAEIFGVPPNPYSVRFRGSSNHSSSVRVIHH